MPRTSSEISKGDVRSASNSTPERVLHYNRLSVRPNSKLRSHAEPLSSLARLCLSRGAAVSNGAHILTPNNRRYFCEIQDNFAACPNLMQGYRVSVSNPCSLKDSRRTERKAFPTRIAYVAQGESPNVESPLASDSDCSMIFFCSSDLKPSDFSASPIASIAIFCASLDFS